MARRIDLQSSENRILTEPERFQLWKDHQGFVPRGTRLSAKQWKILKGYLANCLEFQRLGKPTR